MPQVITMMNKEMLYYINPEQQTPEELKALLEMHPEIKFVSFMGVDFAGNDTDEKVPINLFIEDINSFLEGMAAQTDGSSVVLPGIATLNNARVDMKVDKSVNWYIDYNYEHFDAQTGKMVGTLRIPCFLIHNEIFVDSRSILQNSLDYVEAQMLEMFKKHIRLYDKGAGLLFPEDVKRYFSNYIAAGSVTCRTLRETLLKELENTVDKDVNRFESVVDGRRTYLGHLIPVDAPPRPDASAVWDDVKKRWAH